MTIAMASGLGLTVLGLAGASPVQAAGEQCEGLDTTIVATADGQTVVGTDGPDVIHTAGFRGVQVDGGDGDDVICAVAGTRADLDGGPGDDVLVDLAEGAGEARATKLHGGPGTDRFVGIAGTVLTFERATAGVVIDLTAGTVVDGSETDTVSGINAVVGSAFADTFTGTAEADRYVSSVGPDFSTDGDTISTGAGRDVVTAYGGTVYGGPGGDRIAAYGSTVHGGRGYDRIALINGGTARGGPGNDTLSARGTVEEGPVPLTDSLLFGGGGNDVLSPVFATGQGGADCPSVCARGRVVGGTGTDTLSLVGRRKAIVDLMSGESGRVRVHGGRSDLESIENVRGSARSDIIRGDAGPNRFSGNGGNDALAGRGGNDRLDGGPGYDVAKGGAGNDTCLRAEVRISC